MCLSVCSRRYFAGLAGSAALATLAPTVPVLADSSDIRLDGGRLTLKKGVDGKLVRPGERVLAGDGGAVLRSRDQLFYLDAGTDAEFDTDSSGKISTISVVTGGILSLFGPKTGQGTKILSANASASIRGTTTYFAWQAEHERTYVCCCYGTVDLENQAGGGILLDTTYHNAVILPPAGGAQPAPYDAPLDHYDDDIAALEARAGRQPRWQLPGGKMNFFAPHPAPPQG